MEHAYAPRAGSGHGVPSSCAFTLSVTASGGGEALACELQTPEAGYAKWPVPGLAACPPPLCAQQCIWQSAPTVDQDMLLAEEQFAGEPLPSVTRGLSRLGYHGDEEVFEYTGPAVGLLDVMLSHLTPGTEYVER